MVLGTQKSEITAVADLVSGWGNSENSGWLYFFGLQNHCRWWLQPWNQKTLAPWKESYDQPKQHIKKQRHYFANKGPSSQGYGFSSGHIWMWELDCEESWAPKNWCFWTVVLEKTLESPLDCKEIKPVHPKGNQSWIFIGRADAEAETPVLWPPDAKSWLIWKDPDAGKDWGQEEKGMTEDEMVWWHHGLNGHEFGESLGVGDGQGGCSPWGRKESDTTEQVNWTQDWATELNSRPACSQVAFFSLSIHMAEEFSRASFKRPNMRALPSWPNHFLKAPLLNTITSGFRISTYEFGGSTNIKTITLPTPSEQS